MCDIKMKIDIDIRNQTGVISISMWCSSDQGLTKQVLAVSHPSMRAISGFVHQHAGEAIATMMVEEWKRINHVEEID